MPQDQDRGLYPRLRDGVRRVVRLLCYLGMFLLIPLMLLTSAEVVGRGLWSRPIPGTMEISSYLLSIFILLGLAYTQQVKGHVRVNMLTSRLPERLRLGLEIFTTLLSILIVAIICWQGWVIGMEERSVSDMLRIPQRPFRLLVAVAALLLLLELTIDLIEAARRLARR
jgi:TRAP-type C4-dicarboxylate transport system permease small subunit